jgi:hypothetical protein
VTTGQPPLPRWQGTYPVEGDSAVAELLFGEEVIGAVRLVGKEAHVAFYPATTGIREFDLDDFVGMLEAARIWLTNSQPDRAATS